MGKKRKKSQRGAAERPRADSREESAPSPASLPADLPAPGSLRAWVLAARPKTLPVAFAPVLVGAAIAYSMGMVRWGAIAAALAAALLIQIGTNFANDVFDHEKGADGPGRIGPVRALQAGLLSARALRMGMIVAFGAALALGAYLAFAVGPVIVAIGVVSILSGIAYTGGPFPLAYNGLGDLFVFLFFGFVAVVGATFVGSGHAPLVSFLAAIPVGALATAVLVVNNVRDHENDARTGKKTLVVRFGRKFGVAEYVVLLVLAFATPGIIAAAKLSSPWILLSLAAIPRAMRVGLKVATTTDGPSLNKCLADTAQLLIAHSMFIALGIAMMKVR